MYSCVIINYTRHKHDWVTVPVDLAVLIIRLQILHVLDQYRPVITYIIILLASQKEKSVVVEEKQTVAGKHLSS